MEWFKRAPGVKIFLLIWLLVALVPLWRLRAARQWEDDQINSPNMGMKLGLSPESASEAARRFPNDVAAQLNDIWPRLYQIAPNTYSSSQTLGESEQSKRARQKTSEAFGRYAALSRRFPGSNLGRAQWLRDTTRGALAVESDELLATDRAPDSTRPPTQNWISREQLETSIQVAQGGARLEPDNAFWPWMEAIFGFSLRRDEAALQALQKAGKCARFEDGINETMRERIALMHRVQTADFDDDLFEMWNVLLPHLGRLRQAARAAMWQAKLALGRGDTARALQITGIVQRASAPIAHSRGLLITPFVGEAHCYIAWHQMVAYAGLKTQKFTAGADSAQNEAERRAVVEKFAAYARRNGRNDLAQSALKLQASFNATKLRDAWPNADAAGLLQSGTSSARFHWLGARLLQMAVWSAVLWLLTALLWREKAPAATRRTTLICAAFCVGATGALLGAAIRLGAVQQVSSWASGDSPPPQGFDFQTNLPLFLLVLWATPLISMSVLAAVRFGSRSQVRGLRPSLVGQTLLYAALLGSFWIVVDAVSQPLENTIAGQLWPAPPLIFVALLLATCVFQILRARQIMKPGACLLAGGALLWAPVFLISQSRFKGMLGDSYGWAYIAALVLLLGAGVWWVLKSDLKGALQNSFVSDLGARIRLTAATLAVASSIAYQALNLAAIPVHHQAQVMLDRQLKIGEVALLEEQLVSNPK